MKVKIGNYTTWYGPYQLAKTLMFWVPDENDSTTVHKFGEYLAYGSVRPEPEVGEVYDIFSDGRKPTLLHRFLSWIDSKKKRTISIRIDPWDTWDMNTTLGYIVRPMLKQLKEKKKGAPKVDYEDVPKDLRPTKKEIAAYNKDGTTDDKFFERWNWIIDEMIFAFESLDGGANENWEEKFRTGNYNLRWKKLEKGCSEMVFDENHTAEIDWEGRNQYQERISNGFKLFGKYYESLWNQGLNLMNSIFWFLVGMGVGFVLFDQPHLVADAGNWLIEQSKNLGE